jgi:aminoglycoside/choline kinase family phosphotransferase
LQENKANYLVHMPRVWRYIQCNLRAPGLQGLKALIDAEFPSPANLNWTV